MGWGLGKIKSNLAGILLVALALAGAVALFCCADDQNKHDTLVVATADSIFELDPSLAISANSMRPLSCIYETLVRPGDKPGEVVPWLATNWSHEKNGKVWYFTLREGVSFHDGTPLTAELAADSIRRSWGAEGINRGACSYHRSLLGERGRPLLEKVDVVSERKLRITLRKPIATLLEVLAQPALALTWVSAWREDGSPVLQGTGPFMVEDCRAGQRLTLRRFDNYWHHFPTCSRIVFRTMRSAAQRAREVERGHVDIAWGVGVNAFLSPIDNRDFVLIKHRGSAYWRLVMNCAQPPFSDIRCRFGVQRAFPKDSLAIGLWDGEATPALCCLPQDSWAYPHSLASLDFDLIKARSWFSKGTGKITNEGQTRVELLYNGDAPLDDRVAPMAEALVRYLNLMGFKAYCVGASQREFRSRLATGFFQVALLQTEYSDCDPDIGLSMQWYEGEDADSFVNVANFSSERLMQALGEGRTSDKSDLRRRAYARAVELLREGAPEVPLVWAPVYSAYKSQLQNVKVNRLNMFDFSEATFN